MTHERFCVYACVWFGWGVVLRLRKKEVERGSDETKRRKDRRRFIGRQKEYRGDAVDA